MSHAAVFRSNCTDVVTLLQDFQLVVDMEVGTEGETQPVDTETFPPVDAAKAESEQQQEHENHLRRWQNYDFEKDIPADKLREHIQFLMQNVDINDPTITGFDEEFNVRVYTSP